MATSELYKTTGITELVNDDPENSNQPVPPVKIIPLPGGTGDDWIFSVPAPVFGGRTQVGSDTTVPSPGGGGGDNTPPSGPYGNYILLSTLVNGGYSGMSLPPTGTVIIDDL